MKNKSRYIVIALLIVLVGIGGFYYGSKIQNTQSIGLTNTPKYPNTYVNTLHKYSISYPTDWSIESSIPGGYINIPTGDDQRILLQANSQHIVAITIEAFGPDVNRGSFAAWAKNRSRNQYFLVNKTVSTTFAGVDAIQNDGILAANDPIYVTNILFTDPSETTFFSLTMHVTSPDEDGKKVIHDISQTFTFH